MGAVSPESISRNARLHLLQARVFASVYCNEALSFLFVPARKIRMAHFISKLPAQPLPTSWWMEVGSFVVYVIFAVRTDANLPYDSDNARFFVKGILVPDSTENPFVIKLKNNLKIKHPCNRQKCVGINRKPVFHKGERPIFDKICTESLISCISKSRPFGQPRSGAGKSRRKILVHIPISSSAYSISSSSSFSSIS